MSSSRANVQRNLSRGRSVRRARVEIVPLIDVMFLLVAFFMVVSISMVHQRGIFVDLSPAETSDSSLEEPDAIVISVDKDGKLYLNKEEIEIAVLEEELQKAAAKNSETPVIMNADREARHGRVITALDLIRKSALHNVIFSIEPKE
ncbi:biopolymer transporter ExbD [bacterium]|nr:biopolymer transporter ExbD [bacterium]